MGTPQKLGIIQGEQPLREVSARFGGQFASRAALKALPPRARCDGMMAISVDDLSLWKFDATSALADTTESVVLTPATGSGRWIRADKVFDIKLAFDFNTADAAVLFTVPAGLKLKLGRIYWEVTTSFTGGATPAIGLSSSNAAFNTKGDLLGGASGDLTATLVSTGSPYKGGTLGAKLGSNGVIVLVGGDTIRFDRIASAFAAGVGFAHIDALMAR